MSKKVDPRKWQPPEIVEISNDNGIPEPPLPWYQWFDEQLNQAKSLRTIAKSLKISHVTLLKQINLDPVLQRIATTVQKNWAVMLKERAFELAMDHDKPNTTLMIYLLKTIGGLGDGAQKVEDPNIDKTLYAPMTKAQALKKIEELRKTQKAEEKKLAKVDKDVSEAY